MQFTLLTRPAPWLNAASLIPKWARISSLRKTELRSPIMASAPIASSLWPGAPILRTKITSNGTPSRSAIGRGHRHPAPRQGQHDGIRQRSESSKIIGDG